MVVLKVVLQDILLFQLELANVANIKKTTLVFLKVIHVQYTVHVYYRDYDSNSGFNCP